MNETKCRAHLTGSGLSNVGAFCGKPAAGKIEDGFLGPSPRCTYHLGVERRREARRNAPDVHKAWASTTRIRDDGSVFRTCAECGAPF